MTKVCAFCGAQFDGKGKSKFCSRPCFYSGRGDHGKTYHGGARTDFRGDFNARLDKYTHRTDGCWTWIGNKDSNGYGKISLPMVHGQRVGGQKEIRSHRAMYERYVGPIPAGLDLDHLCRNRACVNPAHLEPVTRAVNLRRGVGINAMDERPTHCPRGHEYTPENTYVWWKKPQQKTCRTCDRERRNRRSAA